jgi:hypothetical protein
VRRVQWCGALVGVLTLGVLAFPGAAMAAAGTAGTGSVGSAPAPTTIGGDTAQFGPGQEVGTSFSVTACGFVHGTGISVAVNGTTAAAMNAEANGCTTFGVVVSDPHLTVNGGPAVAVNRGWNDIVSIGASSDGGTRTDTYTFRVMPAATTPVRLTTITAAHVIVDGISVLALLALGYLVLTFTRRRAMT